MEEVGPEERVPIEKTVLSSLPLPQEAEPNPNIESALLVARHPGAANCLEPVAKDLLNRGVGVFLKSTGVAEDIWAKSFSQRETVSELPSKVDFLLLSNDEPRTFEINTAIAAREKNPDTKIVVVEDFPGSVAILISELLDKGITPDLVLTTTRSQAREYSKEFPGFSSNLLEEERKTIIIPIGQPSFDSLLKEDMQELALETRKKLGVPEDAIAVSYIGAPAQDFPDATSESVQYKDLNSLTLIEITKALIEIARTSPKKQFYLINRPHPREKADLWDHPVLTKLTDELPNNLHLISHSKEEWEQLNLSTRSIYAATDLATMIMSTVGQEAALAGVKPGAEEHPAVPMYVMLENYTRKFIKEGLISQRVLDALDTPSTPLVRNREELKTTIERCLFDLGFQHQVLASQEKIYKDEYRFKAQAAKRVYLWMRLLQKYMR